MHFPEAAGLWPAVVLANAIAPDRRGHDVRMGHQLDVVLIPGVEQILERQMREFVCRMLIAAKIHGGSPCRCRGRSSKNRSAVGDAMLRSRPAAFKRIFMPECDDLSTFRRP